MLTAEYDHRIRIAIKDRLPKSTNHKYEVGDQVVFKDAKDGKMHDARVVGIDGPVAILRWGKERATSTAARTTPISGDKPLGGRQRRR